MCRNDILLSDTPKSFFLAFRGLIDECYPAVSVLKVTLLDALQTLVELCNNGACLIVLANVVVLVVVEVIDVAQRGAYCSSSALGCLINLGKLLNGDRTALYLKTHVLSNLLEAHVSD